MAGEYKIQLSDGTNLTIINPLEVYSGTGQLSTPRQIKNIFNSGGGIGSPLIVGSPATSGVFVLSGDVTFPVGSPPVGTRLQVGEQFTVTNTSNPSDPNIGTYAVLFVNVNTNGDTEIEVSSALNEGLPFGLISYATPSSETFTSLEIPGRGILNYGEYFAENLIHILENFSSSVSPNDPLDGQQWWNESEDVMYIFNGTVWSSDVNVSVGTGIFDNGTDTLGFRTDGTTRFNIQSDGTLVSTTTNYETLVTLNNDIPNKKYVDDTIASNVAASVANITLDDLGDVDTSFANVGDVLVYIGGSPIAWVDQTPTLNFLSDVNIGSPSDNQVLTYDSVTGQWINQSPIDTGATILDELTDVTIGSPSDNSLLAYDATSGQWIDQNAAQAGLATDAQGALADSAVQPTDSIDILSDVTIGSPSDNSLLAYDATSGQWINQKANEAGLVTTSDSINVLSDVDTTGANIGDVLVYLGSPPTWIDQTPNLDLLSDVNMGSPINNDVLAYNGVTGEWSNSSNYYTKAETEAVATALAIALG